MNDVRGSKSWICVLVGVAFAALAISGVLMLLHLRIGLALKSMHVVMGLVFIAVGAAHLALNWKTFIAHLGNRSAIIVAGAAVLVAALLLVTGESDGAGPHRYGRGNDGLAADIGEELGTDASDASGTTGRGFGPGGRFGNGRAGGSGN